MKIELKNIKYSAFASHETHCYQAALYVDGIRTAIVSNDGHGGCDYADPVKGKTHDDIRKVEAWLKNNGNHSTYLDGSVMHEDLEMRCVRLMNDWHRDNEVKKILRRISYIKGEGVYQLPAKHKPTAETLAMVKKASWWKPDYIMLSGLPFAEAVDHLHNISYFGDE